MKHILRAALVRRYQQLLRIIAVWLAATAGVPVAATADEHLSPYHILSIGINTYQASPTLALRGCVNDAKALAQVFRERAGSVGEPKILLDEQATQLNIANELVRLVNDVPDGASVLIVMAGHGARDGGQWYFLPHDYDPNDKESTALWGGGIASQVNKLIARRCRVVLILDVCHAGAVRNDLWKELSPKEHGGGVILLASTIPNQASLDVVADPVLGPHGMLTASLLEAFEFDQIQDGQISLAEIRHHIPGQINHFLETRHKVPGLPLPEQAFFSAATLSIPDTVGLLPARNRATRRPDHFYAKFAEPVEFPKSASLPASIQGSWFVEAPIKQHGVITDLQTGGVIPAAPLLGSDGQPFQERYELVLKPDDPQPKVPSYEGGERGVYVIRHTTPAGDQFAVGRYAFGKYGRPSLQFVFENGTDYVEVTQLDAERLTFQRKRTWILLPSQTEEKSKPILSETIVFELKRAPAK